MGFVILRKRKTMKYTPKDYLSDKLTDEQRLSAYEKTFGKFDDRDDALSSMRFAIIFGRRSKLWRKFYYILDGYLDETQNPAASQVNHPTHYGGESNPYEAIKVIEAWQLGFNLGNVIKYVSRAGKKGDTLEDLRKAAWYLQREIQNRENE